MEHKVISRISDGMFRYQAWPSVARAQDGTLFVGCSGHRLNHICPFGKGYLYISKDDGESWAGPQIIHDTYCDDRDVGLLTWGEGNVLATMICTYTERYRPREQFDAVRAHQSLTDPLAHGLMEYVAAHPEAKEDQGTWTRISRDNGVTWSEKRPAPITSPHGPCRLADGRLFFVGIILSPNGGYNDTDIMTRVRAYVSENDGETWELLSILPVPEGFDRKNVEPFAIQMANGDILATVRYQNHTGPSRDFLGIYTTISHDGGKTWEKAEYTDIKGAPAHLLQHSSGAVVMTYSKRCGPQGSFVRVSRDFGKTWSEDKMISLEAPDWDHGYPSSVELANGDIFTVYYQKCPGDKFNSIHSVRYSLDEVL